LRRHTVAHVVHDSLLEYIVFTTDFGLVRVGQTLSAEDQLGIIQAIRMAIDERRTLYVFLQESDGIERTLLLLMELLNNDLKRLSPIKRGNAA